MTRVSLKEAYDNKDVVAQIYAIRDIAEGASDTADSAKTAADDAKTYVDTLGVQVEGAVQTANNASASAQTSAQTVSRYDARLTEVEGDLNQAESDIDGLETGLGAVTARIQTAEGQIVTIQGRVTALETADGQNVKINRINEYAVGLTGNQTKTGILTLKSPLVGQMFELVNFGSNATAGWYAICKLPKKVRELTLLAYTPGNLNFVLLETNTHVINVIKWVGNYAPNQNRFAWAETADAMILYVYSATYRTNIVNVLNYSVYGTPLSPDEIDKSVFTGQPVTKPEVGGDVVAVYDETLLNQVSS